MSEISNQAAQAASDVVMSKVAIAIRTALLDNIDPNVVHRG